MFVVALKHMFKRCRLHVSYVACVLAVNFLLRFTSGHVLILSVDNHTEVTMFAITLVDIVWLVFTSEEVGAETSDATEGHSCCIEQVPGFALVLNCTVHAFRFCLWLFEIKRSIDHCIVNWVHSVSNIWIEFDASVLRLGHKWLSFDGDFLFDLLVFIY